MRLVGEAERLLDLLDVGRREVLFNALGQRGDGGHTIACRFSRVAAPYGLFQRFGRAPGKAGLRRLIGGECRILWPHRACRASGLASHVAGHDKPYIGTLRSISMPTFICAISRSAATAGLSLVSIFGVWPCASWRAR